MFLSSERCFKRASLSAAFCSKNNSIGVFGVTSGAFAWVIFWAGALPSTYGALSPSDILWVPIGSVFKDGACKEGGKVFWLFILFSSSAWYSLKYFWYSGLIKESSDG